MPVFDKSQPGIDPTGANIGVSNNQRGVRLGRYFDGAVSTGTAFIKAFAKEMLIGNESRDFGNGDEASEALNAIIGQKPNGDFNISLHDIANPFGSVGFIVGSIYLSR